MTDRQAVSVSPPTTAPTHRLERLHLSSSPCAIVKSPASDSSLKDEPSPPKGTMTTTKRRSSTQDCTFIAERSTKRLTNPQSSQPSQPSQPLQRPQRSQRPPLTPHYRAHPSSHSTFGPMGTTTTTTTTTTTATSTATTNPSRSWSLQSYTPIFWSSHHGSSISTAATSSHQSSGASVPYSGPIPSFASPGSVVRPNLPPTTQTSIIPFVTHHNLPRPHYPRYESEPHLVTQRRSFQPPEPMFYGSKQSPREESTSYPFKPDLPQRMSYHRTMEALGGPRALLATASNAPTSTSEGAETSPGRMTTTATAMYDTRSSPMDQSPCLNPTSAHWTTTTQKPTVTPIAGEPVNLDRSNQVANPEDSMEMTTEAGGEATTTVDKTTSSYGEDAEVAEDDDDVDLEDSAYSLDIAQHLQPYSCSGVDYIRACARSQQVTDQGIGGPVNRRHFILWPDLPAVQVPTHSHLTNSTTSNSNSNSNTNSTRENETMQMSTTHSDEVDTTNLNRRRTSSQEHGMEGIIAGTDSSGSGSGLGSGPSEASTCAPPDQSPESSVHSTSSSPSTLLPLPTGLSLDPLMISESEAQKIDWRQRLLPSVLKLEPAWTEWNWSAA